MNATLPKAQIMQTLQRQKAHAMELVRDSPLSPKDYKEWRLTTLRTLKRLGETNEFADIFQQAVGETGANSQLEPQLDDWLREGIHILDMALDDLRMSAGSKEIPTQTRDRIFLVHGHDSIKEEVARFLMKLHLNPILLEEQPSRGRTLIEKFEESANAHYAIVLLTPDDIGAVAGTLPMFKERARQNVIFELGYFIGKLGREHVCVIHKGALEIPSDYAGVVYIPWEKDWKSLLIAELKAAKFAIDANSLYN